MEIHLKNVNEAVRFLKNWLNAQIILPYRKEDKHKLQTNTVTNRLTNKFIYYQRLKQQKFRKG